MAESSQNWNIEIVPGARRVKRAADVVRGLVRFLPDVPLASHGDHFQGGAAVMLDEALDEPVQYPIIDDRQPRLEFPGGLPGEIGGVVAVPRHSATIE